VRRRIVLLVGVAAAVVVVAVLAFRPSDEPVVVPTATTVVTSATELVVQPLDPPIECELELCPSLAVSPEGTLVAYDQAAKTLTWFDAEPYVMSVTDAAYVMSVTGDLDAEHVQLEAIGTDDTAYLLAGSPDTESWGTRDDRIAACRASGSPNSQLEHRHRTLVQWPLRAFVVERM
jgi:hypothetical protein